MELYLHLQKWVKKKALVSYSLMWSGRKVWPIRIGCLEPHNQLPRLSMLTMRDLTKKDFYFVCMEMCCRGFKRTSQLGLLLCVREGASTSNITMGLLQACYIRKSLISWKEIKAPFDTLDSLQWDWLQVIEDSRQWAKSNLNPLTEQMLKLGWAVRNVLLSTNEQVRYSFVDDQRSLWMCLLLCSRLFFIWSQLPLYSLDWLVI